MYGLSESPSDQNYSKKARTRQTRPLARIHLDLAGGGKTLDPQKGRDGTEAPEPSRLGVKYVMIITDDAIRFRWCFFLQQKSEAITYFHGWLIKRLEMGHITPAFMVSDNEFNSHQWTDLRKKYGIEWLPSAPHSQWQDGVSERSIKIVFDRARALMLDAPHMPWKFWADAVEMAVGITNLVPTSMPLYNDPTPDGIDSNKRIKPSEFKQPLGAWANASIDCGPIHRWGSPVWVHLHGSEKLLTKLAPRSKRCYLVASIGTTNHRVWDPEKDVVFTTNDVVFEDDCRFLRLPSKI